MNDDVDDAAADAGKRHPRIFQHHPHHATVQVDAALARPQDPHSHEAPIMTINRSPFLPLLNKSCAYYGTCGLTVFVEGLAN